MATVMFVYHHIWLTQDVLYIRYEVYQMDGFCTVVKYVVYFGSCLKSEWLPRLTNIEET